MKDTMQHWSYHPSDRDTQRTVQHCSFTMKVKIVKVTLFLTVEGTFLKQLETELYVGIWTAYLYPGIKDVVLRLNRVHVLAIVKVVDRYYNNRRRIKHLRKIKHLVRKYNVLNVKLKKMWSFRLCRYGLSSDQFHKS